MPIGAQIWQMAKFSAFPIAFQKSWIIGNNKKTHPNCCQLLNTTFEASSNGLPGVSAKESACNAGDAGLIPGLGGSPGRRHGNPLQYSCLENLPMVIMVPCPFHLSLTASLLYLTSLGIYFAVLHYERHLSRVETFFFM